MMDDKVLQVLRAMAWQKAKGELLSIVEAYWSQREDFERTARIIEAFIKEIEDNTGLV